MNKYFDFFGEYAQLGVYQSVSKPAVDRAFDFSKEWYKQNLNSYSSRNQNTTKVITDHAIGKIEEEALVELCRKRGIEISDPDYTIKSAEEKKKGGWKHDADLVIHHKGKTYKIHKKSRPAKYACDYKNVSWMVEKNFLKRGFKKKKDSSTFDENDFFCGGLIFHENNDYFAHCIFLTGFSMLDAQKHDLFGPTDRKQLKTKSALYFDHVPNGVEAVGFKNTVLNSSINKMKLFKELELC